MRVLIVGGTPAQRGGVEAFCERAAEALGQVPGWGISVLPAGSAYLRPARLPSYLGGLAALARQGLTGTRPDCVWLQYVNLPDLGYLVVARLVGLPTLVTPHLGSNWRSQSVPWLRRLSRALLGLARRIALLSGTQVTEVEFPTAVPRSMIRTFLPRPLLQAPLRRIAGNAGDGEDGGDGADGADGGDGGDAAVEGGDPIPALRLLHSARLSEGKGSFLFIEVCLRLAEAGVAFEARITGSADDETAQRLRDAIARSGLGERLRWEGRADLDEQIAQLEAADVLVHLSVVDSYPLIVLEALAFGVRPICIDLAGARDMVRTYVGDVVPQAGAVEGAVEIIRGLDRHRLRRDAAAVAEQVRRDYDWRTCVESLVPAISAVASTSRRG